MAFQGGCGNNALRSTSVGKSGMAGYHWCSPLNPKMKAGSAKPIQVSRLGTAVSSWSTTQPATGAYDGSRPLGIQDTVSFQVTADGNWTIRVEPLRSGGQPAFSGTGDRVSPFFDPPPPGQWLISGDGKNLNVQLHCVGGDVVAVDDTNGPFQRTAMITFSRGLCFWEVQSNGNWSLKPQT